MLKETFAQAIAAGDIELKADSGKLVVTVIGEEDSDDVSDSDDTPDEGEIESEIMELTQEQRTCKLTRDQWWWNTRLSLTDLAKDEGYAETLRNNRPQTKLQQEVEKGLMKIELVDDKIDQGR